MAKKKIAKKTTKKRRAKKKGLKKTSRNKPSGKKKTTKKARVKKMVKKVEYVAPARIHVKEEVLKLLKDVDPPVDPKLVNKLDWWALYTIHQDVVKDGKDPQELAQRLIRGYDPAKIRAQQAKEAEMKKREEERKRRAKEAAARKAEAKRKAAAAKAKARAAREKARAARMAAREKARAAKAKARAAKAEAPAASATPVPSSPATPAQVKAAKPARQVPASAYVAPPRKIIKDELVKIMPMIKRSDLTGLDWWALYTMHTDIVKYGRDPEELARKFIKGYKKKK